MADPDRPLRCERCRARGCLGGGSCRHDSASRDKTPVRRSVNPFHPGYPDTTEMDMPRERRARIPNDENRVPKARPETSGSSKPRPLEYAPAPSSQIAGKKEVRFDDHVSLSYPAADRFSSAADSRRDTTIRGSSRNSLGTSGNGDSQIRHGAGVGNSPNARLDPGERQRGKVPAAPIIPRLPTPDFDSEPAFCGKGHGFCSCCEPDEEDGELMEWRRGKAKMDKQVESAKAHISRTRASGHSPKPR
ncbi:hypothetical protein GGS20DRAFT_346275 [Poronia punctata]|nr:hypothetical protein GGS20DRAFT_346275 [Poronia punctata]